MPLPFPEPVGPSFRVGSPSHLAVLAIFVLFVVAMLAWRSPTDAARNRMRWALAIIMVGSDLGWHVWYLMTGQWSIASMLPLQLCALTTYLCAAMLVTRSYFLYELVYFYALGGSSQALFTPDIPYDFPNPRFLLNFVGHGAMVFAALYMTKVEGYRPTWRSAKRAALALLAYAVPIFWLNVAIGSNYLFIGRKPDAASPLDVLPPWPWYVPLVGLAVIVMVVVLYAPFAIADMVKARRGADPARPAAL
jgi:hypothetical integral membrane protein (TIGR02206 family)